MSVAQLASVSDHLFVVALVAYSLAMITFAADFAFARNRGAGKVIVREAARERVLVGVGAAVGEASEPPLSPHGPSAQLSDGPVEDAVAVRTAEAVLPVGGRPARDDRLTRVAVSLTVLGWLAQIGSVTTRGLAAGRVPWGNMFEFSTMVALVAVTGYLVLALRYGRRDLGLFVLVPVTLYLGLAGSVLYVPAGPLVPALNSYWLKIHVAAAITATGTFMVGGVVTVLFLLRDRYDRMLTADRSPRWSRLAAALPSASVLDRVQFRIIAFAFPVWTFAVVAGAIWAEAAWGRYWGWDPKETASFVTWVVYAGYLHARATGGWAGRKAAWFALGAFGCLLFDYYAINTFVVGLHSYAR